MSLPEARRKRILGGDAIAGNAFGVRASGLADRRYGMSPAVWKSKPVALFGCPAEPNLGHQARIGSGNSQPKNPRPRLFHKGV